MFEIVFEDYDSLDITSVVLTSYSFRMSRFPMRPVDGLGAIFGEDFNILMFHDGALGLDWEELLDV